MRLLSGRWPTLLLYYLKQGTKRFSDLKRDNPGLSHRMLALELRKLEDAGIVRRTAHAGYPLRVDYDLTPSGWRLVPLIDALGDRREECRSASSDVEEHPRRPMAITRPFGKLPASPIDVKRDKPVGRRRARNLRRKRPAGTLVFSI